MLTVLVIKGALLPGAGEGMKFYVGESNNKQKLQHFIKLLIHFCLKPVLITQN
jgi:hypothetical protein